jgi:hypothetical protein
LQRENEPPAISGLSQKRSETASHQARDQVFVVMFANMLTDQKHRRVAAANNNLAAQLF